MMLTPERLFAAVARGCKDGNVRLAIAYLGQPMHPHLYARALKAVKKSEKGG